MPARIPSRPLSLPEPRVLTLVVAMVVLLGVVGAVRLAELAGPGTSPVRGMGAPASAPQEVAPRHAPLQKRCSIGDGEFVPTRLSMQGVTGNSPVWGVPRTPHGVPGTPPISEAGKAVFGWDEPGVRPGGVAGTAILDAHTWPDGTALGNKMLSGLKVGHLIALYGADGRRQCYRVSREVEIHVTDPDPAGFYSTDGAPMITFIVCSGERLGPGNWSHRTIWFADPVQR